MIPKALFLTFLTTIRLNDGPPTATQDVTAFDRDLPQHQVAVPEQNYPIIPNYQHGTTSLQTAITVSKSQDIDVQEDRARINFDNFEAGDWPKSKIINGEVQLISETNARIWNLTEAFPHIPRPDYLTHAWGDYPHGNKATIKFLNGAHGGVEVRLGYIVNQKLVPMHWQWSFYPKGEWVGGNSPTAADGSWIVIKLRSYWAAEEHVIEITDGNPSGVLLIDYIEYDKKPWDGTRPPP